MPLTYQPFAETPGVDDLSRDLRMNLSDFERVFSGIAGATLSAAGLSRRGPLRWLLLAGGVLLLHRGWTGRCAYYEHIGLDQRHSVSGVPGNRGVRVERSVEVFRPANTLYEFWRNLDHLPKIMRHVKTVRRQSDRRSHWTVNGPLGVDLEWESEVINDEPGQLIAWQSMPGATVRNAGSVRFESTPAGSTIVKVAFEFDPPGGSVGAWIAGLIGTSPEKDLAEDLQSFKEFAERELWPAGNG